MKLILISLVLVLTACSDDPKQSNDNVISAIAVNNARSTALGNSSVYEVEANNYVHVLSQAHITTPDGPVLNLIEESKVTVLSRVETAFDIDYWLFREVVDHIDEAKPIYKFKNVVKIQKQAQVASIKGLSQMIPSLKTSNETSTQTTGSSTTYYSNLSTKEISVPLPKKVQQKQNCPGCTVKATKITYNITVNEYDSENVKVISKKIFTAEHIISEEVPFMAAELLYCISTLVKPEGVNIDVLYKNCQEIYDFK